MFISLFLLIFEIISNRFSLVSQRKGAKEIIAGLICTWIHVCFTVTFSHLLITTEFFSLFQSVWEKNTNLKDEFRNTLWNVRLGGDRKKCLSLGPRKTAVWEPDTPKYSIELNCRTEIYRKSSLLLLFFLLFD